MPRRRRCVGSTAARRPFAMPVSQLALASARAWPPTACRPPRHALRPSSMPLPPIREGRAGGFDTEFMRRRRSAGQGGAEGYECLGIARRHRPDSPALGFAIKMPPVPPARAVAALEVLRQLGFTMTTFDACRFDYGPLLTRATAAASPSLASRLP